MRRSRMHDSAFKAKVAFEAAKGDKTIAEIAAIYEVHPNQVSAWKKEFLERLPEIFNGTNAKEKKDNKIKEEYFFAATHCAKPWRNTANQRYSTRIMDRSSPGSDFTGILEETGVTISMDGKGRALDNIYCERLWRTVKYEEIFLKSYDSVPHLRNELDKYFRFYDYKRGHSAHGYKTPWEVYSTNSKFWKTGATA